jgi:hypothetical protein
MLSAQHTSRRGAEIQQSTCRATYEATICSRIVPDNTSYAATRSINFLSSSLTMLYMRSRMGYEVGTMQKFDHTIWFTASDCFDGKRFTRWLAKLLS